MTTHTSSHRIIIGDARTMTGLADRSVHLVVTSPPYWQIKDYGPDNQIGFRQSYEDYINHLNLVWSESFRVLDVGCRMCINIGDQYARASDYGRYKVIPIRTEIIRYCESRGFDYMGAIIWQKVSTTKTSGGATIMGSFPFPRNGILKLDYEFILIFKKPGKSKPVPAGIKQQSKLTTEEWNTYFSGHWNFPGKKQQGHQAMFPEELPARLIKMFSFKYDTVLDPFLGSGTTTVAAEKLNRSSVGIEINSDFQAEIRRKTADFSEKIHFEIQDQPHRDFDEQISRMNHRFTAHNRLTEKSTPVNNRSLQNKPELTRIKKIISATEYILSDGIRVSLLGIHLKSGMEKAAMTYVKNTLAKSRVYTRTDPQAPDTKCYLYLENRTFVNAHFIKKGLALPDSTSHKYQTRFQSYYNQSHK